MRWVTLGLLRQLRRSAGLSQAGLAIRSGVSARTIGGIESGAIRVPQDATLTALAEALGLDGGERVSFLSAWRLDAAVGRPLAKLLDRTLRPDQLIEVLDRQASSLRDVTQSYATAIDVDRLTIYTETTRTVVATGTEPVDRMIQAEGRDPTHIDVAAMTAQPMSNCRLGRVQALEPGIIVTELMFDRPLIPGRPYRYSYRQHVRPAYRQRDRALPESETVLLIRALCPVITVEVDFSASGRPAAVWQIYRRSVADPPERLAPVTPSPFGIAQVIVENAPPGVHGLSWEWPTTPETDTHQIRP